MKELGLWRHWSLRKGIFKTENFSLKKVPEKSAFPCIYYKSRIWSSQDARVHILVLFTLWYQDSALRVSKLITNFHSLFLPIFFSDFFRLFWLWKKVCVCAQWEDIQRQLIVGVSTYPIRFHYFFLRQYFFQKISRKIFTPFEPLFGHFCQERVEISGKKYFFRCRKSDNFSGRRAKWAIEPKSFLGCPKWFE